MTHMFATTIANAEAHTASLQDRIVVEDLNLGMDEAPGLAATAFLPAEQASGFDWSLIAGLFTRRQLKHA